jgi:nickel-dependent lactate racemase
MSAAISAISPPGSLLATDRVRVILAEGLATIPAGSRILVLIPDHTRSLPLPMLFREMINCLGSAARLDFMVALGTHPALDEESLCRLVGITPEERRSEFKNIGLLNHAWDDHSALAAFGVLEKDIIHSIAAEYWHPSLPDRVEVKANRAILDYDHIIVLGPTFPHEVVGFSGGAKYFFPGISGPEMINATHWLGALAGVTGTIGIKDTPVRAMIHAAAEFLPRPVTLVALVVEGSDLGGLFIGDLREAWSAAADLSSQRHIRWCEKPYRRVLSCAPPMYDEL